MDLPVYEMRIDPAETSDIEVMAVALVDKPAIERNFLAFNSNQTYFKFDEEKRIISGPAMVPDTLIYRQDANGQYNVFFSKDTIKDIAIKFAAKGYAKQLNLFHDPALPADGVVIFNSFVSDASMGISPMAGFEDLPDGTWFISAKVNNDAIWSKIKAGEVRGFSVEGNFSLIRSGQNAMDAHLPEKSLMADIKNLLASLKAALFDTNLPPAPPATHPATPAPAALSTTTAQDGTEVTYDKLEVGGMVQVAGAPAPAGELTLSDGTCLTIGEGGMITAVEPAAAAPTETPEQQMSAMQAAVKKFASGTPEERMANHEVVIKALMEYCFGWDLRQAEEKATRDQAIQVYKSGFDTHKQEQESELKKATQRIEKLESINKQLFELVEQLADTPTASASSSSSSNFSTQRAQSAEQRRSELADRLAKMRKEQKVA